MSPTKSNKLALQGVVNKLTLADAMTLRDAFTYSSILEQCYNTRVDPVSYLSKTFKHPVTLLSAMFDTGCILVGSRALEFFVPGSDSDESAWKFFVPGYKEETLGPDVLELSQQPTTNSALCTAGCTLEKERSKSNSSLEMTVVA
ncbi:hypothetical protein O9K51_06733 [Purpureocillium lavendulum]|uniref:Uncharacterized protein n=1 Tax=Purpureocillium lavendulum TaxID=1247861 RepID=A0AB34FS62_9HYPO|nr:hypothetical protein O9K51_06733 [Purpureocillium lavendulum]